MCSMGKGNQPSPFTETLPASSAEALTPEAAGDSAPTCRSVLPSLYCWVIVRVLDPDSSVPLAGYDKGSAHLLPRRALTCSALLGLLMIGAHGPALGQQA